MAEVWQASHPGEVSDVALKLVTPAFAGAVRTEALWNEVQSVARLDHPHIIRALDFGVVQQVEAEAAQGMTVAGAPWLAMELATGGTLSRLPPMSWPQLRAVLLAVCDALAHAHARGVIHRDLKPSNLLVCGAADLRPGLKLADFGIAAAGRQGETQKANEALSFMGTPAYMAPEQITGRWREIAAHTDLYALGCLAHALTTGQGPYVGATPEELAEQHLFQAPPQLAPIHPMPEALGPLVAALLRKDPRARPQRAAQVAYYLAKLKVQSATPHTPMPGEFGSDATIDVETVTLAPSLGAAFDRAASGPGHAPEVGSARSRGQEGTEFPRAPFPTSWGTAPPLHDGQLLHGVGAGMALLRMREPPLVGRQAVRDTLWSQLSKSAIEGEPVVTILRGAPGMGKTRLLHWLLRRAHELNVGDPWLGEAGDAGGLTAQLRTLLSLRPDDVAEQVGQRLAVALPALPSDAKQDVIDLLMDPEKLPIRRRVDLLAAVAAAWPADRILVVGIDDAHRQSVALHFVEHCIDRALPICVVLATPLEGLAERPLERRQLDRLEAGGAMALELRPLTEPEQLSLVRYLLGLRGDVVRRVVQATAGIPGAAVSKVKKWAKQAALRPTAAGFELASEPSKAAQPALNEAAATELIERWQAGALELSEQVGLYRAALADGAGAYQAFDAAYRRFNRLGDIAAELDVLARIRSVLDMDEASGSDARRILCECRTAGALTELGSFGEALEHAGRAQRLAEGIGDGAMRAKALHIQGGLHRNRLQLRDARRCFEAALDNPQALDTPPARGSCELGLGIIDSMEGSFNSARLRVAAAEEAYAKAGPIGPLFCAHVMAYIDRAQGRIGDARQRLEVTKEAFTEHGMTLGVGFCLDGLGDLARVDGHLTAAESLCREAIDMLSAVGSAEQTPRFNLALTLAQAGRFDEAEAMAQHGFRLARRQANLASATNLRAVLAVCAQVRGDAEAAREHRSAVELQLTRGYVRASVSEALALMTS